MGVNDGSLQVIDIEAILENRPMVVLYGTYLPVALVVHNLLVCVCVFFPLILDIEFVGRTSRGHTGGRSHRISHPPFCVACLH